MIQQGLTNLQLELIKLFQFDLTDKQLLEIKSMLSKYFVEQLDMEMDKLWDAKKWDEKTIEEWSREHMRTKQSFINRSFIP
ncbi:MAG: hypothetical protein ABI723_18640 [Bacteroidia bacterium]